MPVSTQGGSSVNPPSNLSTPQQWAAYLDANLKGSDGKIGSPVTALTQLGITGSSIGDQFLNFYNVTHTKYGNQYTLNQYGDAFVVIWTDATLGQNLANLGGFEGQLIQLFSNASIKGTNQAAKSINNVTGGLLSWENAISGFLGGLESGTLWIRVAKVIVGGTILIVGFAKLTNLDNTVAKAAVKAAPLL